LGGQRATCGVYELPHDVAIRGTSFLRNIDHDVEEAASRVHDQSSGRIAGIGALWNGKRRPRNFCQSAGVRVERKSCDAQLAIGVEETSGGIDCDVRAGPRSRRTGNKGQRSRHAVNGQYVDVSPIRNIKKLLLRIRSHPRVTTPEWVSCRHRKWRTQEGSENASGLADAKTIHLVIRGEIAPSLNLPGKDNRHNSLRSIGQRCENWRGRQEALLRLRRIVNVDLNRPDCSSGKTRRLHSLTSGREPARPSMSAMEILHQPTGGLPGSGSLGASRRG